MDRHLQARLTALTRDVPEVAWSVSLRDTTGRQVAGVDPDRVLSTASIGKLLLLVEAARQYEAGTLDPAELLDRTPELAVADSGLWQHLRTMHLPVEDLVVLVAGVSDNLATNVLLERVGLRPVQAVAGRLGMASTTLLDRVRDDRGPGDPPRLSEGAAGELAAFMAALGNGTLLTPGVSARVDRWLSFGADLSMVAAAFGLDPLAHVDEDRGLVLRNKTGTAPGVRADVGFLRGSRGTLSYAVVAGWVEATGQRGVVLRVMREIGTCVLETVQ